MTPAPPRVDSPAVTPEQSFLAFRMTRDPARLGEVFDRCADDLFAVALHLCRDRAEAEDAVQATFLVAIEQSARWDGARSLQPWLLGILHREVRQLRRRARRQPRPDRMAVAAEPPPELSAMGAEVRAAVGSAIDALPEPYRGVVELRVVHALPHDAIAARLSRSPGAVRTQLWRGLELLRRALPAGLGVALGAQLFGQPALAAVRSQVLQAARTSAKVAGAAGGAAVAGFTGALLMKKVAIAAALVAACAWVALQWSGANAVATPVLNQQSAATAGDRAAAEPPAVTANEPMDAQRELVARDEGRAASVVPAAQAEPSPQVVSVVVVDRRGDAVPDATVALFDADRSRRKEDEPAEQRRAGPPFVELQADALGHCEVRIARECFVEAHKAGFGSSNDVRVAPGMNGIAGGLRLRVAPTVRVRGTVLLPDGTRGAGAEITCWRSSWGISHQPAAPPPAMQADANGAFSCDLVPPGDYRLRARLGDRYSELVQVDPAEDGADHVVTLQFAGAFSVSGRLLDVEGRPLVGGKLVLPRLTKVGDDGSFEVLLTSGGRVEVLGGIAGQTLAHTTVELTDARPHQQITLRTTPFIPIAGKVVDERGEPLAGLPIWLRDTDQQSQAQQQRWALYGTTLLRAVTTASDGTFRWQVPADLRFRIRYQPVPGVHDIIVDGPEVVPPVEDVRVVVTDADRQRKATGFELRGRVVDAATGEPLTKVRVHVIDLSPLGGSKGEANCRQQPDGTFAIGPVPIGEEGTFFFDFEAEGHAPQLVGPFRAAEGIEEATVRMPTFATLDVLVLRADGTPAPGAKVVAMFQPSDAFGPQYSGEAGADGRVHIDSVRPGEFIVSAWLQGLKIDCVRRDMTIVSGGRAELRLVLPR